LSIRNSVPSTELWSLTNSLPGVAVQLVELAAETRFSRLTDGGAKLNVAQPVSSGVSINDRSNVFRTIPILPCVLGTAGIALARLMRRYRPPASN
jgi:hypothetical protein